MFCADIARLLQYFTNISDRFRNILAILQYFQGIFRKYCRNIPVLCGKVLYEAASSLKVEHMICLASAAVFLIRIQNVIIFFLFGKKIQK